jgi:hypothetical protein
LFALVNFAMADGFIAGWNTRYFYNFWRPVTAIRAGDSDGNEATAADPSWETFLNTPAIPDYPSTHSVLGAAAAEVMARFFDADNIAFTVTRGRRLPASRDPFRLCPRQHVRTPTPACMPVSISGRRAEMA